MGVGRRGGNRSQTCCALPRVVLEHWAPGCALPLQSYPLPISDERAQDLGPVVLLSQPSPLLTGVFVWLGPGLSEPRAPRGKASGQSGSDWPHCGVGSRGRQLPAWPCSLVCVLCPGLL